MIINLKYYLILFLVFPFNFFKKCYKMAEFSNKICYIFQQDNLI